MTIIELINKERIRAGVKPLSVRSDIQSASNLRAREASQLWSHTRPDGTPWYTADDRIYGENLAKGFNNPADLVKAWMNSTKHREVMLNQKFKGACVGTYKAKDGSYTALELTLE